MVVLMAKKRTKFSNVTERKVRVQSNIEHPGTRVGKDSCIIIVDGEFWGEGMVEQCKFYMRIQWKFSNNPKLN